MNVPLMFAWSHWESVVEPLGWVLVHSLWQFACVAVLAAAATGAMRRRSAGARYVVLVLALATSVAASLVTWMLLPSPLAKGPLRQMAPGPGHETQADADPARLPSHRQAAADMRHEAEFLRFGESNVSAEPASAVSPLPPADPVPDLSWAEWAKNVLRPWLAWIVAGWSLGIVVCSSRPLLGWYTLWRLQRIGISPAPDEARAASGRIAARLGLHRAVRQCCNRRSRRCRPWWGICAR